MSGTGKSNVALVIWSMNLQRMYVQAIERHSQVFRRHESVSEGPAQEDI